MIVNVKKPHGQRVASIRDVEIGEAIVCVNTEAGIEIYRLPEADALAAQNKTLVDTVAE